MSGRIAAVNFTRFGDVLQSGPLLTKLKAAHPAHRITVLALDVFAEAAMRLPAVDDVVSLHGDELMAQLDRRGNLSQAYARLREITRHPGLLAPDLLVNLSHTPLSATLCGMLEARKTLGLQRHLGGRLEIDGIWFAYLLSVMQDRSVNPFNLVEIYARMVEPRTPIPPLAFDVSSADRDDAERLLQDVDIDLHKPLIVLQPGASTTSRQWPAELFAQLAMQVRQHEWQSLVVGAKTETELALTIERLSVGAARSVAGLTSLGCLAGVLSRCQRLISNDTGTIHLAAALGVPTVGVYIGPAAAKDTAPYGVNHFVLEPDLPCAPCGYRDDCADAQCRQAIVVGHVLPLVLLPPDRAAAAAAKMQGVRVYHTSRTATGEAALTLLNKPATGVAQVVLDYYREFWIRLLDHDEDTNSDALDYPEDMDFQPIAHIREIAAQALQVKHEIEDRLRSTASANADLPELLRNHLLWQDRLRRLANQPSVVAPLARFILVLAGAVRGDSLTDYLTDMNRTIGLLQHGVWLMSPELMRSTWRSRAHAPA